MNQELWFPQPIWFADHEVDFTDDIAFCKKLQSESDGRVISNRNGWQSGEIDIFAHKEMGNVANIVDAKMKFLAEQLDKTKVNSINIKGSWVNINNRNSYNVKHCHAGAAFAGCIYLQVPKNSGDITFYRPDTQHLFPIPTDIYNPVLYRTTVYTPRAGLILIFPAWLEHAVSMSAADEDRISIAFNISIQE